MAADAVDLDLVVEPADVDEISGPVETAEIAAEIQQVVRIIAGRIGHKGGCLRVGAVDVASSAVGRAHGNLADLQRPARTKVVVQDVNLGVRERTDQR